MSNEPEGEIEKRRFQDGEVVFRRVIGVEGRVSVSGSKTRVGVTQLVRITLVGRPFRAVDGLESPSYENNCVTLREENEKRWDKQSWIVAHSTHVSYPTQDEYMQALCRWTEKSRKVT